MLKGIDISKWQDDNSTAQMFDPVKAYAQGVRFIGIKVSQANWIDQDFVLNWANCKPYLYRMPYHFLTWDVSANLQAETFWNAIEPEHENMLPMICDFEWWSTTPAKAMDIIYAYLERLKTLSGSKPKGIYTETVYRTGIYTAKTFWDQFGSAATYWKQHYLWLCDISGEVPIPLPWEKWDFWQYTFKLDGIAHGAESKDLDGDYYNGTLDDLKAEFGLTALEVESVTETTTETVTELTDAEKLALLWDAHPTLHPTGE